MGQVITWSVRDETLHCNNIIRLFHTFVGENPDLQGNLQLAAEIRETCTTIVGHEDAFVDLAFEQGPVQGLSAEEVKTYIRYIADRRMVQLGYPEIYAIANNPYHDWMRC